MIQTPKQWTTTALIFGMAIGLAAAALPSRTIAGRIELDPTIAAKTKTPAIVFVIARDEARKGHPLLAKRIDVQKFPISFVLGPEDAMMGGTLPARMLLEARIDRDGDAATHDAGAPSASVSGVALGTTNIVLRLR